MRSEKIITVFGSSRTKPGSDTYELAYRLGGLLAESGFVVCNGGYIGIMEASSLGAKELKGKTIGIVTEAFKMLSPNPWSDEKILTESYIERLDKLIHIADGFVILKGGIGTLSEMVLVWCLNVIGEIHKPVILIGDKWQKTINDLKKHLVIDRQEMQALKIVKTPEDAVRLLKELI